MEFEKERLLRQVEDNERFMSKSQQKDHTKDSFKVFIYDTSILGYIFSISKGTLEVTMPIFFSRILVTLMQ